MKFAVLLFAAVLTACATMPEPGTVTAHQAADKCRSYAYQQDEWGWGVLSGVGIAIGMEKAKDTPEYSDCMAHAGFAQETSR